MTSSAQADGITMSGGGIYSLATIGAKHVIDSALPMVVDAIDAIPAASFEAGFMLADMGCADAGTSLSMIESAVNVVRKRSPGAPVSIIYTDQPRNDFNALMMNVHGLGSCESYLQKLEGVYPLASGTSFYRQAVAPGSLHVGFSATAMHWLSAKPGDITDHVHMVGARGAELRTFKDHARRDWRQILICRAAELVPGGRLVLVNFCIDEQGRYLGNTGGVNMFGTFNEVWLEFLDQGRIERAEYAAMTLPQYYNTVEEFCAPLSDPADPVYQAGLRLVHIETRVVRCPFAADFETHGDAARFADAYIPTIRTWNESTYFNALSTERPLAERREIIESYYQTYKARVRRQPEGHGMDYVHAYMAIEKVA